MLENQINIPALNETFLQQKFKFHLPGYDIYNNDRFVGTKGGVAIQVKKGIIVNQEWNQSGAWYAEAVDRAVIRKVEKN